jgi:hypothetical protein
VNQTVGQKGSADRLYITLCQLLLKTTMEQDILPTTPPGRHRRGEGQYRRQMLYNIDGQHRRASVQTQYNIDGQHRRASIQTTLYNIDGQHRRASI